jgi:hypothetical protein
MRAFKRNVRQARPERHSWANAAGRFVGNLGREGREHRRSAMPPRQATIDQPGGAFVSLAGRDTTELCTALLVTFFIRH